MVDQTLTPSSGFPVAGLAPASPANVGNMSTVHDLLYFAGLDSAGPVGKGSSPGTTLVYVPFAAAIRTVVGRQVQLRYIGITRKLLDERMYPLTLEGLDRAIRALRA